MGSEDEASAFFSACELYEEEPEVVMGYTATQSKKDKDQKKSKQNARRSAATSSQSRAPVEQEPKSTPQESKGDSAPPTAVQFKV